MARAYSPVEVLAKKIPCLKFEGIWEHAFGHPGRTGVWIIWGASGNGKSSFAMQLAKELCKYGRVAYNSLEESLSLNFQRTLKRFKMDEEVGRFLILDLESKEELSERLSKKHSPDFVIIDSAQYWGIKYEEFKALKEKHRNKLFIYISHAEGKDPQGIGYRIAYDADLKIQVEGYRAMAKARSVPNAGAYYTIWEEGAEAYWNKGKE